MCEDYPVFIEKLNDVPIECLPLVRQPYSNCHIEAGVTDHATDSLFLRFVREGEEPTMIFLRPDEGAAICYALSGVLFTHLVTKVSDGLQLYHQLIGSD